MGVAIFNYAGVALLVSFARREHSSAKFILNEKIHPNLDKQELSQLHVTHYTG